MAEPQREESSPPDGPEPIDSLSEPSDELDPDRLTYQKLRSDEEIVALINASDTYLKAIGYTDHGLGHLGRVSSRAYRLLKDLKAPQRQCELAAIGGLLHDIGNVIHREGHAHHSALMCFNLLRERGMGTDELTTLMSAIANHDDEEGEAVSQPAAALIIADKSDVLRSRVRNPRMISFDIHDRVNYAAKKSALRVDRGNHMIELKLEIDTDISKVMEYFEIFLSRMRMCRRSAVFLNCDFHLVINDVRVL